MNFLKGIFSDNGAASYSRCASGFIVMAVVGWVSYVIFKTHTIPALDGPSMFLGTGVGVHYGSNKLPDIMGAFKKQ